MKIKHVLDIFLILLIFHNKNKIQTMLFCLFITLSVKVFLHVSLTNMGPKINN